MPTPTDAHNSVSTADKPKITCPILIAASEPIASDITLKKTPRYSARKPRSAAAARPL